MMVMACFGILVILFNLLYLHPLSEMPHHADTNKYSAWLVVLGAGISFMTVVLMILFPHASPEFIGLLFFILGFLAAVPLLTGLHASGNLLIFIATGMLIVTVYAATRKFIFKVI